MKKIINLKFFSVLLLRDEQVEVNGIKFIEPQSFTGFSQENSLKLSQTHEINSTAQECDQKNLTVQIIDLLKQQKDLQIKDNISSLFSTNTSILNSTQFQQPNLLSNIIGLGKDFQFDGNVQQRNYSNLDLIKKQNQSLHDFDDELSFKAFNQNLFAQNQKFKKKDYKDFKQKNCLEYKDDFSLSKKSNLKLRNQNFLQPDSLCPFNSTKTKKKEMAIPQELHEGTSLAYDDGEGYSSNYNQYQSRIPQTIRQSYSQVPVRQSQRSPDIEFQRVLQDPLQNKYQKKGKLYYRPGSQINYQKVDDDLNEYPVSYNRETCNQYPTDLQRGSVNAKQLGYEIIQPKQDDSSVFYEIMAQCQCDSNIDRVQQRFNLLQKNFQNQLNAIQNYESTLKSMNPKYQDISIQTYYIQNSKLGEAGQATDIIPEKTFDQIIQNPEFDKRYMTIAPGQDQMHPCFFYCLGKYSYYQNLVDSIRKDMWHQNRYIKYLNFLINKDQGDGVQNQQPSQQYNLEKMVQQKPPKQIYENIILDNQNAIGRQNQYQN